jgi:hypothetical protein
LTDAPTWRATSQEGLRMNRRLHASPRRSPAVLWVATPLLAVLATVPIVTLIPAEPAPPRARPPASAPYTSSDPSLPAPGTYTITAEPQPHVQAF